MTPALATNTAQAWVELKADDPEAASALEVARSRLAAGRDLVQLERARLIEIRGSRRPAAELEALLHASSQFYNPHKERAVLRSRTSDPTPGPAEARLVLVWERGGDRRPAAERWWGHEAGEPVEVREGVVWRLRFAPGADADAATTELARLRDARRGLLCNPWSQEMRIAAPPAPLPWIALPDGAGEEERGA